MKPQAIIFDFDGVLIDSLELHLAAWSTAVKKLFGLTLKDPQRFAGHATKTIAHILATECGHPSQASTLAKFKDEQLLHLDNLISPLPGAIAACKRLKQIELPFAIATNSTRNFIERMLNTPSIQELRSGIIMTIDDVTKGKPNPEIYLECSRQLGVERANRSQILVFEDSPQGLVSARAAGMLAIGVTTALPAEALLKAGAFTTCKNLDEALDLGWFEKLPVLN